MRQIGVVVALCAFVFSPGNALAWWECTHGNSGLFETPSASALPTSQRKAWGVDVKLKAKAEQWLHYSVPAGANQTYSKMYIYYTTFSGGYLKSVHITNGPSYIKEHDAIYVSSDVDGSYEVLLLPFGAPAGAGIGVSILIGGEKNSRIVIGQVCIGTASDN